MNKFKTIRIDIIEKIAVLKFNRPDQLNAMNKQMMDEIIEGIQWINGDKETSVALIIGEGRAFMAGADIKEYGNQTLNEFVSFQENGKQLYKSIETSTKPWIAAVNGFALGGGFEIALSCDLIVASEEAKAGLPEVFLSLIPGGGGTQRLIQKVGMNRVKEMLFFGASYKAPTLAEWGIVNQVFGDEHFFRDALDYAMRLSRRSPTSIAQLKRLANLSLDPLPFDGRIDEEANTVKMLFNQVEAKTAIKDFINKGRN